MVLTARWTQVGGHVVTVSDSPKSRITQVGSHVAAVGTPKFRVTQVGGHVVVGTVSALGVTFHVRMHKFVRATGTGTQLVTYAIMEIVPWQPVDYTDANGDPQTLYALEEATAVPFAFDLSLSEWRRSAVLRIAIADYLTSLLGSNVVIDDIKGLPSDRYGSVTFASETTKQVVFDYSMPHADYHVSLQHVSDIDARGWTSDIAADRFTLTHSSAVSGTVYYRAQEK